MEAHASARAFGRNPFAIRHSSFVIPRRSGFTLVELLVVIAIIGILASLLLPALAKSKSTAQRAKCVSNLHQLGLAAEMYWDEHDDDCFRFGPRAGTNGGQIYWFGWIDGPSVPEGQRRFDPTQGELWPNYEGRGVDLCPSFDYGAPYYKPKARGASYGYGYNLHLSVPPNRPPVKISSATNCSSLVIFADAAQVNDFQAPASPVNPMLEEWYYVNATEPTAHFRHRGFANAVFVDGHADFEKPAPGSLDARLPQEILGTLRAKILLP